MKKTNNPFKKFKQKHRTEPVMFSCCSDEIETIRQTAIFNEDKIISPLKLDLRQYCVNTESQGDTPHCVAYASTQLVESMHWKRSGNIISLNAKNVYLKCKKMDGFKDMDGTFPETGLHAVLDEYKENYNVLKTDNMSVKTFYNTKSLRENKTIVPAIKHLIHKHGLLLGAFMITKNWYELTPENNISAIHPLWFLFYNKRYKNMGGHCVLITGYTPDYFIIQNSWGINWGSKGFALIDNEAFINQLRYVVYYDCDF